MGRITAIDREGEAHALEATSGLNLMEILRDGGLDVEAICGGQCVCSTCHVYIDKEWVGKLAPRGDTEQVLVEDSGHFQENSRLSCQIDYDDAIDGLKLELAPEH
jgi:2Fe-2S ferredoxin